MRDKRTQKDVCGEANLEQDVLKALHACLSQKRHRVLHCIIVGWMISLDKGFYHRYFSILQLGKVIPCYFNAYSSSGISNGG